MHCQKHTTTAASLQDAKEHAQKIHRYQHTVWYGLCGHGNYVCRMGLDLQNVPELNICLYQQVNMKAQKSTSPSWHMHVVTFN